MVVAFVGAFQNICLREGILLTNSSFFFQWPVQNLPLPHSIKHYITFKWLLLFIRLFYLFICGLSEAMFFFCHCCKWITN